MPKFHCRCGNAINLSVTTPAERLLISEENILSIADSLHKGNQLSDDEFFQIIDLNKKNVYLCPVCHRMHVEREVGSNAFDTYVLEDKR